ncbi:hypothetical protein G6L37_00430 [Agrobacterium rubi]|nr:hypothetical protein [Agrobacterium rubi]NTF23855.1 hypothetical protein [Agrobacterium rubi]
MKDSNALERENAALREALKMAQRGLNDWMHVFATDLCQAERVAEAERRVYEHGTLAYIADLNERIGAALAQTDTQQPTQQRD